MKKFRDRAYGVADGTHLKKLKPSPVSEAEERAQYWESRGYHFNPDFYIAYAMDMEVERMKRSQH
jgi:hypothetical protein